MLSNRRRRAGPTAAVNKRPVTELGGHQPVYSHCTAGCAGRSKVQEGRMFNTVQHSPWRQRLCLVSREQPGRRHSGEGIFGPGRAWSRRGARGPWPRPPPRGCGHLQQEGGELGSCPELPGAVQTAAPKLLCGIHAKPEVPTGRARRRMGNRVLSTLLGRS